jgi:hypothetical protein
MDDTGHHEDLSDAERERLAMLAEECGEVIQIVGKILRHGYESYHPDDPSTTNRDMLHREVTDVRGVLQMMRGEIPEPGELEIEAAAFRKLKYSHYQEGIMG